MGGGARWKACGAGFLLIASWAASAASDCAFTPSHADPDGRRFRREASRVTVAFASSHGTATATTFHPVARIRRVNYVDDEIFGKMDADRVVSAPLASDSEFLRRVTLDLTGRIPEAEVVASFLADPASDKRSRMIDTLLASDAFVDRWTFFYDELFQNTAPATSDFGFQGRDAWHAYFQASVRSHKPWDVMARELIAATGLNTTVGAANYVVRQLQPNGPAQDTYDNLAASTATVFLGTSTVFCTSCHNGQGHLDSINLWGSTVKRQDFWGLAAFYSRFSQQRAGPADPSKVTHTVSESASGNYRLNTTTGNKTDRTAAYYTTSPPGLTSIDPAYFRTPLAPTGGGPAAGEGFRQALGRLVTSDPQFARAAVNYLWKEMFGVGIVEPVDGFDPMRQDPASPPPGTWTIQPTHPALVTKLAQDYAAHGYDLRYILGVIARSSAYQLSSFYPGTWNEAYTPYFARHFVRRMMAEEVLDAICYVTNSPPILNLGTGVEYHVAMQLPDVWRPATNNPWERFLDAFFRGNRDGVARSIDFTIPQALMLLNDPYVGSLMHKGFSLVPANATPAQRATALYVRTLSRYPTPAELAEAVRIFTSGNGYETWADIQWALFNRIEFLFY